MDPLLTDLEESAASLGQGRALVHVADEFENVLALKVAVAGDAVGGDEFLCVLTQYFPDLVQRPDEELAFFPLAVGVLRGVTPP
jgi:hypothetical protein